MWTRLRRKTRTHHKKTHTIEGQIRRKKQDHRLNTLLLKKWGIRSTVRQHIAAKKADGQCLTDTRRHLLLKTVDFQVVECVNAVCIIECVSEDQHFFWYMQYIVRDESDDRRSCGACSKWVHAPHLLGFATPPQESMTSDRNR